ncbi:MAG: hypothetical protein LBU32_09355 [Clostridiales bacterium]|jgi:hypothetical protein|nr:hypothetical protein [Clostridiales bacterium]
MLGNIVQIIMSLGLIVGGLIGKFVLRGTNSSFALVAFGFLWLGIDIYNVVNSKKGVNSERIKQSKIFYFFFVIWIVAEFFESAFVGSYGSAPTMGMLNWIIISIGITILGICMFLHDAHKKRWFFFAIAGSSAPIIYSFAINNYVVDVYYYGVYGPRFSAPFLLTHLATNLLPGLMLLFISHKNKKMSEKKVNSQQPIA